MKTRRSRLSIRIQLTVIVILAALLGTGATLLVANFTIQNYLQGQLATQVQQDSNVAWHIMNASYGSQITVNADSQLIAQVPQSANLSSQPQGPIILNGNFDYIDQVEQLTGGLVTIYQCAGAGNHAIPCRAVATDMIVNNSSGGASGSTITLNTLLDPTIGTAVQKQATPYIATTTIQGAPYMAAYSRITDPQGHFIGVLSMALPLSGVQSLLASNTSHLVLAELAVMLVSIIVALLIARAITRELQGAAQQVASASASFSGLATQQASGSAQQVWAINAVNQALKNLGETTAQITHRTEQLAQAGSSILANWSTLSSDQLNAFIAYISRSMHDISIASQQQAKTYARMNGAMQAVTEVAEQVARDSNDTAEHARRLEEVVLALQSLVGSDTSLRQTPTALSPKPASRELPASPTPASGLNSRPFAESQPAREIPGSWPGVGNSAPARAERE